ncbi:MAG: hydroxymethylglutaryl-CoA reductase [Isosphaeraceae bacterium]
MEILAGSGQLTKPPSGFQEKSSARRIQWAEAATGVDLSTPLIPAPEELRGIIENHVTTLPVPMAVAGPLLIDGTYAKGEFVVPVCTVEGTLVLSMTRGMMAFAESGGCRTVHLRQELSRSPGFIMPDIIEIPSFIEWIRFHEDLIRQVAESTTRHGKLLRVEAVPLQNFVILDFVYDTANAAGQNMVTIATDAACRLIRDKTGFDYFLESGFNSDKKPSRRNFADGRGHAVAMEVAMPKHVLEYMGVTAAKVLQFQQMAQVSSHAMGGLGTNLHAANGLASLYLAFGQDVACVAENAVAISQAFPAENDGLICRMTFPSLTVGTVGGGTRLPAQRRNLEMVGCAEGEHASRKLAEIITAASAALEFSLLAAVVSGTFAQAHATYGRTKKADNIL